MVNPEDLPISTHTRVLGTDISVHQQAIHQEVHGDGYSGGFSDFVQIRAVGSKPILDQRNRRYIAAWARRNLFKTQPER